MLVHSNLDDGFAGLFADVSSALGMVLVEKYIVEDLIGARVSHCYGHHFTSPLTAARLPPGAGTEVSDTHRHHDLRQHGELPLRRRPPTTPASRAICRPTSGRCGAGRRGHAINPVPVTENERIPDVDEIIDAQLFAARLVEHATRAEPAR